MEGWRGLKDLLMHVGQSRGNPGHVGSYATEGDDLREESGRRAGIHCCQKRDPAVRFWKANTRSLPSPRKFGAVHHQPLAHHAYIVGHWPRSGARVAPHCERYGDEPRFIGVLSWLQLPLQVCSVERLPAGNGQEGSNIGGCVVCSEDGL